MILTLTQHFCRCVTEALRNSGFDFGDDFLGMGLLPPYTSSALQAQSSSAYSSSTDEGRIPRNTVYRAGSGAFLQVCRVEGSMDFSCALDGSRDS